MNWQPGKRNLITDVPGIRIGQIHDSALRSGVTVLLPDVPICAAVDIRGGATGTRETEVMADAAIVNEVHGLVLSGGSAFGLDAATGVQSFLREKGIGFPIGSAIVPVVPQAILFDLINGGNKDWGRHPPYRDMAYEAADVAAQTFTLGTAGAGFGASVAWAKSGQHIMGGIGSASIIRQDGLVMGALAAVNAVGTVTITDTPHFWAAPMELNGEFGGYGSPAVMPEAAHNPILKTGPLQNTTLAIIATNAALTKGELKRIAIMAQTGLARAIVPVHTSFDGDIVFSLSTGEMALADSMSDLPEIGMLAANTLARAVARGVYEAGGVSDASDIPAFRDVFSRS